MREELKLRRAEILSPRGKHMRYVHVLLVGGLLLALPRVALAQEPQAASLAATDELRGARTSAELLFVHRQELGLTEEQVERLRGIDQMLEAQNQSLRDRLQGSPEPDRAPRSERAELQRAHRQLEANTRAAERQVWEVLTSSQRALALALKEKAPERTHLRGGAMPPR